MESLLSLAFSSHEGDDNDGEHVSKHYGLLIEHGQGLVVGTPSKISI